MNLRQTVMNLRINHKLKGKYPVVVFLIPNSGGITGAKKGYYVMTYIDKQLYFHGLTRFFKRYNPDLDFAIDLTKFKKFNIENIISQSGKVSFISYKGDYLPIGYFRSTYDSKEGEANLQYILDECKKLGIEYTNKLESEIKKGIENGKDDGKTKKGTN